MHVSRRPALSAAAIVARRSRTNAVCASGSITKSHSSSSSAPSLRLCAYRQCRRLHTSPPCYSTPTDPKSPPGSETDAEVGDGQAASEAAGGRSKGSVFGSRRRQQGRRSSLAELPSVKLPDQWLAESVVYAHPKCHPPLLYPPLEIDALRPKVSRIYSDRRDANKLASPRRLAALEDYFTTAVCVHLATLNTHDLPLDAKDPSQYAQDVVERVEALVPYFDSFIDAAWHMVDAIYPARNPEYHYRSRPFWWWHIYRDLSRRTDKWVDSREDRKVPIADALNWIDIPGEHSFAQTFLDLKPVVYEQLREALLNDFTTSAPPNFEPLAGRRPIQVVAVRGHAGRSIAESLTGVSARHASANCIHLDANDIAQIVGGYIGQDLAYSRGTLSTLGFRAAELNGRLPKPEHSTKVKEDDDGDGDSNVIDMRTSAGSFLEELQKTRQGHSGPFSDWENLKINKVLDHIVNDIALDAPGQRLLIHVHDYVELNMTLEGSTILSKLRNKVDAAWKAGHNVVLVGTSACVEPSDEYESMVGEIASQDVVLDCDVWPDRRLEDLGSKDPVPWGPRSVQDMEYLYENAQNINRMIAAIEPQTPTDKLPRWQPESKESKFWDMKASYPDLRDTFLEHSVLPLPEIYRLAMLLRSPALRKQYSGTSDDALNEMVLKAAVQRNMPSSLGMSRNREARPNEHDAPPLPEENKSDEHPNGLNLGQLNNYEKRISSGIINRDDLHTSFADVHISPEVTGALKLLTSLALHRPDAFKYGVLARDKINGCLLYGPPGTGKTMLAKAVAKDSGVNMLEVSGASINDKWVGEAEKLTRAVFTLAQKMSPCVVFIDEADSLFADRNSFTRAQHREVINQFLREWDGMKETNAFVMVATNRPTDLDAAVLRRLPRKLLIDLPDRDGRLAILRLLLREEGLGEGVSVETLADRTPYYSGSDLKNVCVSAAMTAVEEENAAAAAYTGEEPYKYPEKRTLQKHHFEKALKQTPATSAEDSASLRLIKKFDETYGKDRTASGKRTMGFGGHTAKTDVKTDKSAPPP